MKIINFFILIFILLQFSCTTVTKKLDTLATTPTNQTKKKSPQLINRCIEKDENILLKNKNSLNYYSPLLKHQFFKNRNFIDKSLLILLSEIVRRPDSISPNSRLQIFIKQNDQNKYYDFRPKDLTKSHSQNLFFAIKFLSEEFKSSNLKQLALDLDLIHPTQIPMDDEFENFLSTNYKEVFNDKIASSLFLKGDDVITHYETFTRMNFSKLVSKINDKNLLSSNYSYNLNPLKQLNIDNKITSNCNFELSSENDLSNTIDNLNNEQVHYIGFKSGNNSFMAIFSSIIQHPIYVDTNDNFLKATTNPIPVPVCLFQNKETNLFISSLTGRSKSQHLKHLSDYEIYNAKNSNDLIDILNFPRHLFLPGPDRVLYESKKGRKDQLNFFLAMNFPIYHVEDLGNIIGVYSPRPKQHQFFIDDRSKSSVECIK